MLFLVFIYVAACLPVEGERITAADLTGAVPEFAAVAPATVFGWAPAPGASRLVERAELERWARAQGVGLGARPLQAPICFTRRLRPLAPEAIDAALREALAGYPRWRIELLDWPRAGLPAGRLGFDPRALPRPPRGAAIPAVVWRGTIETPAGRRFPVWVRLKLSEERTVVLTARAIPVGEALTPEAWRVASVEEYPFWPAPLHEPAALEGQRVRRSLPAGRALLSADLAPLPAVRRGDGVAIEIASGGAHLQFQAVAEAAANKGQVVLLKNPLNGRRFSARIVAAGRAEAITRP